MGPDAYPEEWTQEEIEEYEMVMFGEPCDCGTVRGESGLYVTHAAGAHPDCTGGPDDSDEPEGSGCGRRTPSQIGFADSGCAGPSGDTAHAARSCESSSFIAPKEGSVASLASEFRSSLDSNIARSRAVQAAMDEEVARREALGIGADHPDAKLFAVPVTAESQKRPWGIGIDQPVGASRRVYAVGFRGRVEQFLGYEDDPDTVSKVLDLGDHWKVRYEDVFEDSISDEWFGRAVSEPGSPERVAEEREAWDDYEYAKTHREEVALDRFEYRGADARGGFSDADEKSRRANADRQLQMELERGATVLGDEKHLGALRDRKRFRALVESFGQDPDAPEIKAWVSEIIGHYVYKNGKQLPERRGYKRCIRALEAKAAREAA